MNKVKHGVILSVGLLFTIVIQSFAVPGLQLSVQCSNVVLSWPTVDGAGGSYMIRRRPDFTTNSSWTIIQDYYSPASGTNLTTYTDEGVVTNAICDTGGGDMEMAVRGGSLAGRSGIASLADLPPLPTPTLPPGFGYVTNGDGSVTLSFDPTTGGVISSGHSRAMTEESGPPGLPGSPPSPDDEDPTNAPISPMYYEVVPDGVTLYGLTNGQVVSGVINLTAEAANSIGNLTILTLQDNDSSIASGIHPAPFEQPVLVLPLDTRQMANGTHNISLYGQWTDTGDGTEGSGGLYEFTSSEYTITVSNEISFPNWIPEFGETGNSLVINATSAHTNATWTIDVYGADSSYVGTFEGSTTNGDISVVWDLIGPDDILRADSHFSFVVNTTYDDPENSSSATPLTYKQTDGWTANGDWVVVNQQAWNGFVGSDYLDSMADGFVGTAHALGLAARPDTGGGTSYRLHVGTDEGDGDVDWSRFRAAIYTNLSRNLFYLGHGTPNGLGQNSSNTNRFITAAEIVSQLATIPAGLTNKHNYRLVCLDGCNTATGTLPESFGIPHKENVPELFTLQSSLRPNAFVGWDSETAAGFAGSINLDHVNLFVHFQFFWLTGSGLKGALDLAAVQPDLSFPNYSHLKVFGDWNLSVNGYNR